jgi:hypothetical protein
VGGSTPSTTDQQQQQAPPSLPSSGPIIGINNEEGASRCFLNVGLQTIFMIPGAKEAMSEPGNTTDPATRSVLTRLLEHPSDGGVLDWTEDNSPLKGLQALLDGWFPGHNIGKHQQDAWGFLVEDLIPKIYGTLLF